MLDKEEKVIELIGKPGPGVHRIRFTARPLFQKDDSAVTIERDLVYGHICPTCHNVIQALFITEKPVDLWKYEETVEISTANDDRKYGTLLNFWPQFSSKQGTSQYTSTFLRTCGEAAQHLVLKNHVIRYHGLDTERQSPERFFEPGGNMCAYSGVFSHRENMALKDLCLLWRYPMKEILELEKYEFTTLDAVFEGILTPNGFYQGLSSYGVRKAPAYGQAPPVILFPLNKLRDKDDPWDVISGVMRAAFRKEVVQQ